MIISHLSIFLLVLFSASLGAASIDSIYSFSPLDINGNQVSLSDFKGKSILIVNVASKCGFTPQYEGLETLYKKYKDKGFVILGFPANDFLWQESGTNEEIKEFCTLNFGVTFPIFSKIKVKGRGIDPLYKYLTEKETNPDHSGKITWNFNKFLINKDGKIVNRFGSAIEPLSDEIVNAIEELL